MVSMGGYRIQSLSPPDPPNIDIDPDVDTQQTLVHSHTRSDSTTIRSDTAHVNTQSPSDRATTNVSRVGQSSDTNDTNTITSREQEQVATLTSKYPDILPRSCHLLHQKPRRAVDTTSNQGPKMDKTTNLDVTPNLDSKPNPLPTGVDYNTITTPIQPIRSSWQTTPGTPIVNPQAGTQVTKKGGRRKLVHCKQPSKPDLVPRRAGKRSIHATSLMPTPQDENVPQDDHQGKTTKQNKHRWLMTLYLKRPIHRGFILKRTVVKM